MFFPRLKYKIVIMLNVLCWKCPCLPIQIVLEERATQISWESWSALSAKGYKKDMAINSGKTNEQKDYKNYYFRWFFEDGHFNVSEMSMAIFFLGNTWNSGESYEQCNLKFYENWYL